jgi:hypothetical protein
MKKRVLTSTAAVFIVLGGIVGIQQFISLKIISRVEQEMPKASGVSASIPLADVPSNLVSGEIKSVKINIEEFALKTTGIAASLEISASSIRKAKPSTVGSLELTATIPASAITKFSQFNDAQIVGNTLQVSAGAGGLGTATLIPMYGKNQLYFELQSISFLGNQIPASSLPDELKVQIRTMSQRNLTPPKGLEVESVVLSEEGLSVNMSGSNIQVGNIGSEL